MSRHDWAIGLSSIWIAFCTILIGGLFAPNTLARVFSCFVFGCTP